LGRKKSLKNMDILIATGNEGKVKEIKDKLKGLEGFRFLSLKDLGKEKLEIIEDGKTFKENALKKAYAYFLKYKRPVISDDSGLMVRALDGAPGINSARFAGSDSKDSDLVEKLLTEMKGKENRNAKFKCVVCFYVSKEKYYFLEGVVEGKIIEEKKGKSGFGYDPVFYISKFNKTFAELEKDIKNSISHRGKALENLKTFLKNKKFT
jgi:non-canonical purine NTP pyrophosphatase (RdgB/HAM1 family)